MKPKQMTAKLQIIAAKIDTRVWCEECCIRIAPNDERTVVGTKVYHPRCHSRVTPAAKAKQL
jgi:hypothetical protein